jgi:hypothetical protein
MEEGAGWPLAEREFTDVLIGALPLNVQVHNLNTLLVLIIIKRCK